MSTSLATKEEKEKGNSNSLSNPTDGKITEGVSSEPSGPSSENAGNTAWLVGDIVWSKIPGHPWWPSMVAYEPNTAVYFKYTGRTRYYHVQFFGHEPMRGWATEKSIRLYEGKDHFLSLRLSTHGKMHKVGNKQLPLWETAVKMADKAVPLNRHERKLCFTFKYNKKGQKDQFVSNSGTFTEILNGFVKSKAEIKSPEMALGEPKPKRKSNNLEKICNGKVSPVKRPQPVLKKVNDKVSNVKDNKKVTKIKQCKTNLSNQKPSSKTEGIKKKEPHTCTITPKSKKKAEKKVETPTTIKLKMKRVDGVSPLTGKRKRGRPPKNFVIVSGGEPDASDGELNNSIKKPKTDISDEHDKSVLNNNVMIKSVEQENVETASDSNSTASMDLEAKADNSKLPVTSKQKEPVCIVCEQPDNLILCEGVCNSAYHLDCLGLNCSIPEKFICDECTSGNHTCFLCRKTTNVVQCSTSSCGKFYHLDCIKAANVKIDGDKFSCPLHYCNVCGPRKPGSYKRRLTCCTRCPTAYHTATCIVAGCLPITSHYLVCKRHFLADKKKAHHSHVNVNWCFVCSMGGTLVCCESCPAAFHTECIDVDEIPEGHFFCRDCATGKELLYGEIVWVKLGMYRWWPAQICNPNNIPTNIQNLHHQPGEFPVQFLGSHDYYWIHRGRVFCYQEGDKGSCNSGGKYLGVIFRKALDEAKDRYADWQKIQEEKAEKDLEKLSKKPAAYKHLKVNRYTTATKYVVEESEWSVCECLVSDENPCGPDSHCLNRILLVECSPSKCPAKEKCQNQCFVKRQYLDCEPFRSKGCGWGLKAKEDGKKGQFIIEYVGELINDATCRERVTKGSDEGVQNYYMLTIDKDCIIDAGPMGNLARFMNHSCNPNCETQKWTVNGEVRVGLFAKREIKDGEELTFDYQLDCLGNEKKKCSCASQNCSGFLGVRPKTQHAQLQEDKKKKAELKKKQKKKQKKNPVKDVHEDECFNCGDGGELIMCDKTGCSKCYHLSCLTMEKKPHGYWLCPWHFCDDCGKAATLRCCECSNSFCTSHADGQITELENGQYICQEHQSSPDLTTDADNSLNDSDVEAPIDVKKSKKSRISKNPKQDAKTSGEIPNNHTQVSSIPEEFLEIPTPDSEISTQNSDNPEKLSKAPIHDSDNADIDSKMFIQDTSNSEEHTQIQDLAQDSKTLKQDFPNLQHDLSETEADSVNSPMNVEDTKPVSPNPMDPVALTLLSNGENTNG